MGHKNISELKRTIADEKFTMFAEQNYTETFKLFEVSSALEEKLISFSRSKNDLSSSSDFYRFICNCYRMYCRRNNIKYENSIDHEKLNKFIAERFRLSGNPMASFNIDEDKMDFCDSRFRLMILYNFQIAKRKKRIPADIDRINESSSETKRFWETFKEAFEIKSGYKEVAEFTKELISNCTDSLKLEPRDYFVRCINKKIGNDYDELDKKFGNKTDFYRCVWTRLILTELSYEKLSKDEMGTQLADFKQVIAECVPSLNANELWTEEKINSINDEEILKTFAYNDRHLNKKDIEVRLATKEDINNRTENTIWTLFINLFQKCDACDEKGNTDEKNFVYQDVVNELIMLLKTAPSVLLENAYKNEVYLKYANEKKQKSYMSKYEKRIAKSSKSSKFTDLNFIEIKNTIQVFHESVNNKFSQRLVKLLDTLKKAQSSEYMGYINKILTNQIYDDNRLTYFREFLYICGFAFGLDAETMYSEMFYKAMEISGLNYRSADEIIYVYFLNNKINLCKAKKMICEIKKKKGKEPSAGLCDDYTERLRVNYDADISKIGSLTQLEEYILNGSFSYKAINLIENNKTAREIYYYFANYISHHYCENLLSFYVNSEDREKAADLDENVRIISKDEEFIENILSADSEYKEAAKDEKTIRDCEKLSEFISENIDCFELDIRSNPHIITDYFFVADPCSNGKLSKIKNSGMKNSKDEIVEPMQALVEFFGNIGVTNLEPLLKECSNLSVFSRRNLIAVYLYYYIYAVKKEVNRDNIFDMFLITMNDILSLCKLPKLDHRYSFDNYILALCYLLMINDERD